MSICAVCGGQARAALVAALKEKSGALAGALEARDAERVRADRAEAAAERARAEAEGEAAALRR